MSKTLQVRDSKDPMPNSDNSMRIPPDGNSPVSGEKHDSKKAQRITGDQRYTLRSGGPDATDVRQGPGGNVPVSGETHDSKKAERITAAQRGGENTGGTLANSPGR